MSDLDYDALRKVAERASTINSLAAAIGGERWKLDGWPQEAIDHIAEFDPPTVLRLLDLAQRAEADRAAVERVRWVDIQPAIRRRLHELRGHTGEPADFLCAACDQDADQLARAALDRKEDQ